MILAASRRSAVMSSDVRCFTRIAPPRHARELTEGVIEMARGRNALRYDWVAIQRYYDRGNGRDRCMARFGFAISTWYKAIESRQLRAVPARLLVDWVAVQRYYDLGHTYG